MDEGWQADLRSTRPSQLGWTESDARSHLPETALGSLGEDIHRKKKHPEL